MSDETDALLTMCRKWMPPLWAKKVEALAARLAAAERRAEEAERERGHVESVIRMTEPVLREVLGRMQKPMERMTKVCVAGLVEPACDHDSLRALTKSMQVLGSLQADLAVIADQTRRALRSPGDPE